MRLQDGFIIGKIVRKHSYKGEVVFRIETDFMEIFSEMESVWLEQNQQLVPFFIEKMSYFKDNLFRVQLEDIDSEAKANALIGKSIYADNSLLPKSDGESGFYKHEIIGFTVTDVQHGLVGTVAFVNDLTPQTLLEIDNGNKTILIPVNEAFILDIDLSKKLITVQTPEGLLDL